jgi:hypothetical protein
MESDRIRRSRNAEVIKIIRILINAAQRIAVGVEDLDISCQAGRANQKSIATIRSPHVRNRGGGGTPRQSSFERNLSRHASGKR